MRRLLTTALAAAMVAAGTGSEAQAQDMVGRRASLFDLGLYGGVAYSTNWFEIDENGFAPGLSSIFGLTATYWATPGFGIRYHTAYFPTELPEGGDADPGGDFDGLVMNNWFFDLNLALRPFLLSPTAGPLMSSMYFFLGGGILHTNIAGDPAPPAGVPFACLPQYTRGGICLSPDPEYATVGQANVGLGLDVFPFTPGIGLFFEGAVHGYDSPAHDVGPPADEQDSDKFAFTPRGVLGLKFMFGNVLPPAPVAPPEAPTPPTPIPEAVPLPGQEIRVCVVQGGALAEVDATYNPSSGDTTVAGGRPFSEAYPATAPDYAAGAAWFINNEPVTFNGQRYVRFGLPRVIGTTEVTRIGEFQGTGIYAEAGATGTSDVIYIPVRPGCEFQPYQKQAEIGKVRG
ncbi:MAG: hypothetical protein M3P24_08255 [Gemmatimonadota bacterium]|nr:hypothetical protein [Gemmatimonadota bacterium]